MKAGHFKLAAGLAVSAGALYLLLAGLDSAMLVQAWSRLTAIGLLGAGVLLALGYALRIVRWWWMLRSFDTRVRLIHCVTPFVASIALNNVLPLRAGDAVRAFGFQRQLGLSSATVLGTVVVERLLDLSMLLVFFFAGAAFVSAATLPPALANGAKLLALASAAVLVGLPLAGPALARRLRGAGEGTSGRLNGLRSGAAGLFESFALLRSGPRAIVLLPLTVLIWALEGAVFATIAADLASGTSPLAAWFAMACGTLATLLPSTPGYVGTFDYFASLGLSAFGASREVATAFSLSVHAVLWLPVTLVGLALLALHGGITAFQPPSNPAARRATST
ncbi:MAG: flippase-like domain-containing protein [Gemmatimonadetes bacterium]|nr:flippase-like domain-containing protein [Gemmatimonadota bacterium]